MIIELEDRMEVIQPKTGFICKLLSADAPDPFFPGCYLHDSVVWSIVNVDERAPIELIGNYVIHGLAPEAMLKKLQKENWETF